MYRGTACYGHFGRPEFSWEQPKILKFWLNFAVILTFVDFWSIGTFHFSFRGTLFWVFIFCCVLGSIGRTFALGKAQSGKKIIFDTAAHCTLTGSIELWFAALHHHRNRAANYHSRVIGGPTAVWVVPSVETLTVHSVDHSFSAANVLSTCISIDRVVRSRWLDSSFVLCLWRTVFRKRALRVNTRVVCCAANVRANWNSVLRFPFCGTLPIKKKTFQWAALFCRYFKCVQFHRVSASVTTWCIIFIITLIQQCENF